MVIFVVPVETLLAERAAVLDAAESIRNFRPLLHGSELAFRNGIVIGNVRSAVTLGNAQIHHQKGCRRFHDSSARCICFCPFGASMHNAQLFSR